MANKDLHSDFHAISGDTFSMHLIYALTTGLSELHKNGCGAHTERTWVENVSGGFSPSARGSTCLRGLKN
jgi:hypothetical protein